MERQHQADRLGQVQAGKAEVGRAQVGKALGRRRFLAGAATTASVLIKPSLVFGSEANSTIELGMIGCGGRGTWIAKHFLENGNYKFVACADYFQDKVDAFGEKYGVDPSRRYTTLSCYKKLLEGKLDAVVIESPPYCHPQQAAAAVDSDRHVYLAKPIAVDVPGCRSIENSAKKAADKKRVFLVDFQTRTDPFYQEAVKRVHAGQIGKPMCGEACYYWHYDVTHPHKTPDDRIRYWYSLIELSGDFIVEQNIHSIDVMTWLLDHHPLAAEGRGGRTKRTNGDIWDHFQVLYTFPEHVSVEFTGIQCVPSAPDDIRCRIFGSKGIVDTNYFGNVEITGDHPYPGGPMKDLYGRGAIANVKTFEKAVREGDYAQPTVPPSVRSNLAAILGREAAYKQGSMTWEEMLKANRRIPYSTKGLKS